MYVCYTNCIQNDFIILAKYITELTMQKSWVKCLILFLVHFGKNSLQYHSGIYRLIRPSVQTINFYTFWITLEWIHSNLELIHSDLEWIHSQLWHIFPQKSPGLALNNIIWKILFGIDSTKIFRVLATTFGSQILKKLFNPSMNSFQYGMNVFQVRMNSFHMGMYSYYYRYSHTVFDCLDFIDLTTD